MGSALNPTGGGGDTAGLHVETIEIGAADYRAAHDLIRRGFWRSRVVRRKIRGTYFISLTASAAGAFTVLAYYYLVAHQRAGVSAEARLGWLGDMLPSILGLLLVAPVVITVMAYAYVAWDIDRLRRRQERKAAAAPAVTLAWNGTRFGVIIDGQLQAWPIAELLAWEETDRHLFLVTREAEALIPIPRDQADPAALAVLRDALADAGLPNLWSEAERQMLKALEPEPRFDDGFWP